MKKLLYIYFIILFAACSTPKDITNLVFDNSSSIYRITKIKTEKNYYVIYASRNDSTFKILSKIDSVDYLICRKIEKGKSYALNLRELFPIDTLFGRAVAPNLGIDGICVNNKIIRTEKKSHYKIYKALNLTGLYIRGVNMQKE